MASSEWDPSRYDSAAVGTGASEVKSGSERAAMRKAGWVGGDRVAARVVERAWVRKSAAKVRPRGPVVNSAVEDSAFSEQKACRAAVWVFEDFVEKFSSREGEVRVERVVFRVVEGLKVRFVVRSAERVFGEGEWNVETV